MSIFNKVQKSNRLFNKVGQTVPKLFRKIDNSVLQKRSVVGEKSSNFTL